MSLWLSLSLLLQATAPVGVARLSCEYATDPLGIDVAKPRLSWMLESTRRGARQTAYHVVVASSEARLKADRGDIWDSGRVASDQSVHVPYGGPALRSRQLLHWKVRVWDELGQPTPWSATGSWEMGLLLRADWQAQWISLPSQEPGPAPHLRKIFDLGKPVRRARVYATARGLYKLSLNGRLVSDDIFRPGWTDYRKRIQYQTYDVTGLLSRGSNAIGVVLGDGWYRGSVGMFGGNQYGTTLQALVQLEVEHGDGTTTRVLSDTSWTGRTGPILSSDLLMGEAHDAQRSLGNWTSARYEASGWQSVQTSALDAVPLVAQIGPSVRVMRRLEPQALTEHAPGTFIADLGQNIVGWARLSVQGPAGAVVRLRFAEMLNPDGSLYTTNLRKARATDSYTIAGKGGVETWEPSFTYHGFRYVEITGFPGTPAKDSVAGVAVSSAWPASGTFESSDPLVDKLQSNIVWGLLGNYLEVPTDCPQRDERLGWMGDAQVFAATASYNVLVAPFLNKWMNDVADAQSPEGAFPDFVPRVATWKPDGAPAWADAGVIVPWAVYQHYGDTRILETHYEAMKRYVDFIRANNPDLLWTKRTGNNYGDWLNIHADTPREVLATAYFARSTQLLGRSARVLGRNEDAVRYEQQAKEIKAAFLKAFVSGSAQGFRVKGDTQTGYLLALRFDLLEDAQRPRAVDRLVDDIVFARKHHLSTGFLGVGLINPVLSDVGQTELAYRLLRNETFPSWGFSIKQGATTIWERWDGWTPEKGFQDPGMNSFNHYALGAVGEWLFSTVAGIGVDPEGPGFKRILLQPHPGGGLTSARATHDSMYGRIASGWSLKDGELLWELELPPNTSARVRVPAREGSVITEGGLPTSAASGVRLLARERDFAFFELGSGRYRFAVAYTR